jgi:hypothetical protein
MRFSARLFAAVALLAPLLAPPLAAQTASPPEQSFPSRDAFPNSDIPQPATPPPPAQAVAPAQDSSVQTEVKRQPDGATTTTTTGNSGSAYRPLGEGGYHPVGR